MNEPKTLLELAHALLEFAQQGNYSSGNEFYGVDEGREMASIALARYEKILLELERLEEFKNEFWKCWNCAAENHNDFFSCWKCHQLKKRGTV